MTKLALTGVLLGLVTACGDNGNDVGFFEDQSMGGTDQGDATTDASGTVAGDGTATSDGAGGTGETSSVTNATADGSGGTTDAGTTDAGTTDAGTTDAGTTTSTGGLTTTTTDGGTTTDGAGGTGATTTGESTSGGSGGETTGIGGTTSSGGSSSGGGTGGGSNATCPAERPVGNSECDVVGVCDYGEGCVQDLMACDGGLWVEVEPELLPTCEDFGPGSYPENGQSCECLGELRCQFLDCDARGTIRASCVEGTWQVQDSDCVSRPCAATIEGDVPMCEPGEICVAVSGGGPAITYECEVNPCADARLQNSCECARALCPESDVWSCEMQEEATVLACVCDQCN